MAGFTPRPRLLKGPESCPRLLGDIIRPHRLGNRQRLGETSAGGGDTFAGLVEYAQVKQASREVARHIDRSTAADRLLEMPSRLQACEWHVSEDKTKIFDENRERRFFWRSRGSQARTRTTRTLNGQKLHLTAKEYQILALLALRIGSTLTKEMFLNHLYGGLDDEPEAKIIDVFICKLRKKLANASGGQDYIETIWGRGYALREPTKQAIAS
jgi:hypothetical protein